MIKIRALLILTGLKYVKALHKIYSIEAVSPYSDLQLRLVKQVCFLEGV